MGTSLGAPRAALPRGLGTDRTAADPPTSAAAPTRRSERPTVEPAHDIVVPDPGVVACRLEEPTWTGSLQLRPGGSAFVFLAETPITLALGVDSSDGSGRVSVDRDGVRLTGTLDKPELYADTQASFSGFVFPSGKTPLSWAASGKVGRVVAILDVSAVFDEPGSVEAPLVCAGVSVHPLEHDGDPSSTLGRKPLRGGSVEGPTELTLVPGKAPVAKLKRGQWPASVLREEGGNVEVLLRLDGFYAVGWIPRSRFSDTNIGLGESGSRGAGIGRSIATHRSACAKDLELFGEAGGERASVGVLRAGTPYVVTDTAPGDDYTGLDLQLGWMALESGARFVVRRAALERCNGG